MEIHRIESFKAGWFLGFFEPSLLKTRNFEAGWRLHVKDEIWPAHLHKISDEFNFLISGTMTIQDTALNKGDVFVIRKGEIANPQFLTNCEVFTIKVPSCPGDKYEI